MCVNTLQELAVQTAGIVVARAESLNKEKYMYADLFHMKEFFPISVEFLVFLCDNYWHL